MCLPISYHQQLTQLDALLNQYRWLWQPQPFKAVNPIWCDQLPDLYQQLLRLNDEELSCFQDQTSALHQLICQFLPELDALHGLTTFPFSQQQSLIPVAPSLTWGIPGRKWQQIEAFVAAIPLRTDNHYLEWCGGKGHLGRLIAQQSGATVDTLEIDANLCSKGNDLADKNKIKQQFHIVDVLHDPTTNYLHQRHPVALHACGELHRELIRKTTSQSLPSLHLSPCCYHLGSREHYQPFTDGLSLQLCRDDLRLAVTETVTAHQREVNLRDQEMAWKLAYISLYQQHNHHYPAMPPINKAWLKFDFVSFCQQLAQRNQWSLPDNIDWATLEQLGHQRQREVMRLSLPRKLFSRAIECWLVLDMAVHLEQHGYTIEVTQFTERGVTPRNLLLRAIKT